MPLPVIADVFRCTLHWVNTFSVSPPESLNIVHVRTTTLDVTEIGNTIATIIDDHAASALQDMSSVFELQNVAVTPLDGTSGATDVPQSGTFGSSGGTYICQGAAVVSLKTGGRGPRARGRIYLGPIAESQSENGSLLYVDDATDAWQAIRTD